MNNNIKYGLKFFGFGIGIIIFLIGWGINYGLVMNSLYELYQVKHIDETTYNFGLYGIPLIGVSVLIGVVLYVAYGTQMEPPRNKEVKN